MNSPAPRTRPLQRWPLITQLSNRGESFLKDSRLVNAIAEKDPNTGEWIVQKRIGYTSDWTVSPGYTDGNGMMYFATIPSRIPFGGISGTFAVYSNPTTHHGSLFKNGSVFGTFAGLDQELPGFNYYFQPAANTLVFASDANVYYISSPTAWSTVTLPSPHGAFVRGLAYLDQTIYFMDEQGNIFGSALDNPGSWSSTNKVIANSIDGEAIQLVQQLNYVIALKTNSMEVFFDNDNPSPGSPLSPLQGAISNYGAIRGSPQVIDDLLFFATSNRTVSPQVMRVDNLQLTRVSTPPVERLLDKISANTLYITSWTFKHGGHRFYGLSYHPTLFPELVTFTIVYDIDENLWYQWTDAAGNFWPVSGMSYDDSGQHILQGMSDGTGYIFEGDYQYPTDNGVVAPVHIYTPNADFGTRKGKILNKMYFNSDQQTGSYLYVSRSDNDYQSWSIPRRVDLGKRRPELRTEGTFTRRAYHFAHMSPTPLRIKSVDLSMSIGVS